MHTIIHAFNSYEFSNILLAFYDLILEIMWVSVSVSESVWIVCMWLCVCECAELYKICVLIGLALLLMSMARRSYTSIYLLFICPMWFNVCKIKCTRLWVNEIILITLHTLVFFFNQSNLAIVLITQMKKK